MQQLTIKHIDFGKRLKNRMILKGMSITELSKLTDTNYEMVRRYIAGISKPRHDKLVAISEALNVTASYLDYGTENQASLTQHDVVGYPTNTVVKKESISTDIKQEVDYNLPPSNNNLENLRYVPVLNFSQAEYLYRTDKLSVVDSFEPVMGSFYAESLYWVMIEDDSMIPEFKRRDLVLIDPDLQPLPSDFVFTSLEDENSLVFRRWRSCGYDETTSNPYQQLLAEHEDYPTIDSRYTPFNICGVAIEHKRKLR